MTDDMHTWNTAIFLQYRQLRALMTEARFKHALWQQSQATYWFQWCLDKTLMSILILEAIQRLNLHLRIPKIGFFMRRKWAIEVSREINSDIIHPQEESCLWTSSGKGWIRFTSRASLLWADETAITTLASPILTTPSLWPTAIAFKLHLDQATLHSSWCTHSLSKNSSGYVWTRSSLLLKRRKEKRNAFIWINYITIAGRDAGVIASLQCLNA